jgi:hypothetical protein
MTENIPQMPNYLQPEPVSDEPGVYEYVSMDGELTLKELKILNLHGYIYQSEVTDVDYDDVDVHGNTYTNYMDIYYFTRK